MQRVIFREKPFRRLDVLRIVRNTFDGTDLAALRFVEMPDAFRALRWVDHVDLGPHRNRVVRALRLAYVAIDALVGNQ